MYPTSFLAFRRNALELVLPFPETLTIQADAHLSGLIVFVAPIVAIPERLAVYRVHGANLFSDRSEGSGKRQELRMRTRRALVDGMKYWLSERGYDLARPDLYAYCKQWTFRRKRKSSLWRLRGACGFRVIYWITRATMVRSLRGGIAP